MISQNAIHCAMRHPRSIFWAGQVIKQCRKDVYELPKEYSLLTVFSAHLQKRLNLALALKLDQKFNWWFLNCKLHFKASEGLHRSCHRDSFKPSSNHESVPDKKRQNFFPIISLEEFGATTSELIVQIG